MQLNTNIIHTDEPLVQISCNSLAAAASVKVGGMAGKYAKREKHKNKTRNHDKRRVRASACLCAGCVAEMIFSFLSRLRFQGDRCRPARAASEKEITLCRRRRRTPSNISLCAVNQRRRFHEAICSSWPHAGGNVQPAERERDRKTLLKSLRNNNK